MKIMDDNFDDHFMDDNNAPKKPEVHIETPEEREERELRESTIERRYDIKRLLTAGTIVVLALLLVTGLWSRYFHVYEKGTVKGVVMSMESRGNVFKTFEGTMMSQSIIKEPWAFEEDVQFSVRNDTLAATLSKLAQTGVRVELSYDLYHGVVLWRGESPRIITGIDTLSTE